ncbi:MAG: hypothetical protein HQL02_00420 [Nitrospirae bacterium]|nr:hypothetical protein [Nitrospirota bacterium]
MLTVTDDKKVSEMTVKELKELIMEVVQEAIDPDFGYELRDDFIESLKEAENDIKAGRVYTLDEVKSELGL